MIAFVSDGLQSRAIFGAGSFDEIPIELNRLGVRRIMLISTPGRKALADRAMSMLGDACVARFDEAVVHVPEQIALSARLKAADASADGLLAMGGGAAIGVAKAVALTSALPIMAVPTTYSGSEMTPVWGITSHGLKQTGSASHVQPRVVIYDPLLTMDLPSNIAAISGLNAIAHCVEALYSPGCNPLALLIATEGIRMLGKALPAIAGSTAALESRESALIGAWLAGTALGMAEMGLHHKLCHTLGGSFDLPHAETHAVMLPYTIAYNREAAPRAMQLTANALDAVDAPSALLALASRLGAPRSLRQLGMHEKDIERAADIAVQREYANPRPVTRAGVHTLLAAAFAGNTNYVVHALPE